MVASVEERIAQAAGEFQRRKVKIGKTTFHIQKMLPMEGFRVFESLRPGLAEALGKVPARGRLETMVAQAIFAMPPATIEAAREALFAHVKFTNENVKTEAVLSGMEDTAFMGCEPIHLYELIARAFAVNFTDSWDVLAYHIPQETEDLSPPSSSISPDSSPAQSTQASAG